ncbi:golgin subfamily A member 6-like protein 6 [Hypomesus transpacificus]|uniref:golgin subfamily A member 6-like protein 6 n=1 Tax=Hypomesus transpacificus TaxID=137520 RepID=UPI001F079D2A|nr:golgin subfamily A member 6-like protein 6 [Hypomesus transpacificus]
MVDHMKMPTELLLRLVKTAGSAFGILGFFLIFQYVFELDFTCPCQQYYDELYCSIYMVVPAVTMFFFVWLIDPERMRICGWCTKNKCLMRRDRKTLVLLGKSVSAASLWIISALIEGDWYVCLKLQFGNGTSEDPLACKDKNHWSHEEILNFHLNVNISRAIGLGIIGILVIIWVMATCRRKEYDEHLEGELRDETEQKCEYDNIKKRVEAGIRCSHNMATTPTTVQEQTEDGPTVKQEEAKARQEEAKAKQEEAKARQEEAKVRLEEAKAKQEKAKARVITPFTGPRQTEEDLEAIQEEDKSIQEKTKTTQERPKAGPEDAIATTSTTGQRQTEEDLEVTQEEAKTRQEEAKAEQEELNARQEEAKAEQEELNARQEEATAEQEELNARQEEATAEQEELNARQEEAKAEQEERNARQVEATAEQEEEKARRERATAEQEKEKAKSCRAEGGLLPGQLQPEAGQGDGQGDGQGELGDEQHTESTPLLTDQK